MDALAEPGSEHDDEIAAERALVDLPHRRALIGGAHRIGDHLRREAPHPQSIWARPNHDLGCTGRGLDLDILHARDRPEGGCDRRGVAIEVVERWTEDAD